MQLGGTPREHKADVRVALDRVLSAAGGGGFCLRHVALEEAVAVGVGVLGGADVGVEGVGGRADRQLLWSHWLRCGDENSLRLASNGHTGTTEHQCGQRGKRRRDQSALHEGVSWRSLLSWRP